MSTVNLNGINQLNLNLAGTVTTSSSDGVTTVNQSITTVPTAVTSLPDWPPSSPTAYDDEFTGTTLAGKWTAVNQTTAVVTVGQSFAQLAIPAATGDNEQGFFQTLPSPTYQFDAKLTFVVTLSNYVLMGLGLYDGTKYIVFGFAANSTTGLAVAEQSTATSPFGLVAQANIAVPPYIYLRIKDDGTNLTFSYSYSGVNSSYIQLYQASRTAFFPSGPTSIGFTGEPNNATNSAILCCDWIRRTL